MVHARRPGGVGHGDDVAGAGQRHGGQVAPGARRYLGALQRDGRGDGPGLATVADGDHAVAVPVDREHAVVEDRDGDVGAGVGHRRGLRDDGLLGLDPDSDDRALGGHPQPEGVGVVEGPADQRGRDPQGRSGRLEGRGVHRLDLTAGAVDDHRGLLAQREAEVAAGAEFEHTGEPHLPQVHRSHPAGLGVVEQEVVVVLGDLDGASGGAGQRGDEVDPRVVAVDAEALARGAVPEPHGAVGHLVRTAHGPGAERGAEQARGQERDHQARGAGAGAAPERRGRAPHGGGAGLRRGIRRGCGGLVHHAGLPCACGS